MAIAEGVTEIYEFIRDVITDAFGSISDWYNSTFKSSETTGDDSDVQSENDLEDNTSEDDTSEKGNGNDVDLNDVDLDNLPDGWTKTENNGFTHVRDAEGNIRIRIDPPDSKTPYSHKHYYDQNYNSLDINGNPVSPKSSDAHIPLK